MKKKTKLIYCIAVAIFISICNCSSFAQSSDSKIIVLANDYKINLINLNLDHWIKFLPNSVNTDSIFKQKQIVELTSKKIKLLNVRSIPFYIATDCNSPGISANAFFIHYEGDLNKEQGQEEFFPSKVPLSYRWKKLPDNILFFIYIGASLDSQLLDYIHIP